jgi:outer membrane protein assembly factor BamB
MKPTFIALLALFFVIGCTITITPGFRQTSKADPETLSTPSGINQTSKVKIGTPIWEFETEGRVWSSPAIGPDGTVYVGSHVGHKLYAINGKTGVKLWEFEAEAAMDSSPAIGSDGTVYVGSNDRKLYAINGKSGIKLWEFETRNSVSSPAIGPDGTVYVGSKEKNLYAINGKSGVKLWEFETGFYVQSSPAIGSDGTVYVGSDDNKLYAIKTDSKGLAKSPWPMRGQNARHTGRMMKK